MLMEEIKVPQAPAHPKCPRTEIRESEAFVIINGRKAKWTYEVKRKEWVEYEKAHEAWFEKYRKSTDFTKISFPTLRKVESQMISQEILSVQPMLLPTQFSSASFSFVFYGLPKEM